MPASQDKDVTSDQESLYNQHHWLNQGSHIAEDDNEPGAQT